MACAEYTTPPQIGTKHLGNAPDCWPIKVGFWTGESGDKSLYFEGFYGGRGEPLGHRYIEHDNHTHEYNLMHESPVSAVTQALPAKRIATSAAAI